MPDLAILVPVLARPHRVRPLLQSIEGSTDGARVLFLCDLDDQAEIDTILDVGGELHVCGGNYAEKINIGVQRTSEPLIFIGADDLDHRPGWFEKAMAWIQGDVEVVGVNDKIARPHRPSHATHFLMTRSYAERPTIDGRTGPLCQAYSHWRSDDELIATATKRGVYTYARDAWVEHLHYMNNRALDDDTYRKGRANANADNRLFRKRAALWT